MQYESLAYTVRSEVMFAVLKRVWVGPSREHIIGVYIGECTFAAPNQRRLPPPLHHAGYGPAEVSYVSLQPLLSAMGEVASKTWPEVVKSTVVITCL